MKIMMFGSQFPPQIAAQMNLPVSPFGGWLEGISRRLKEETELEIVFGVVRRGKRNRIREVKQNGIQYCLLEYSSVEMLKKQLSAWRAELYHVFGTEHRWSYDLSQALPQERTVFSIQGLISVYAVYYLASFNLFQKAYHPLLPLYLRLGQRDFFRRGQWEKKALQNALYCIGRTAWDESAVRQIHPQIRYFKANEILRPSFYTGQWSLAQCQRHTIFVSQAGYPIKAPHMIMEILRVLKQSIPDVRCRIGGYDLTQHRTLAGRLGVSYDNYISSLIRRYGLENHVEFLGMLSEQQVREQLLNSHVFLSASVIENSSNSLAEAMMLGTPSVASDVGGTGQMACHRHDSFLYPFDEPVLAAYYIQKLMEEDDLAVRISQAARLHAQQLYDPQTNVRQLREIYSEIVRK